MRSNAPRALARAGSERTTFDREAYGLRSGTEAFYELLCFGPDLPRQFPRTQGHSPDDSVYNLSSWKMKTEFRPKAGSQEIESACCFAFCCGIVPCPFIAS